MSAVELQTPILEGGIRSVNFFNGRLLTANDLSREQEATRSATGRLGRAIGDGIAYGMEVSQSPESKSGSPILTVEAGLAVNRQGQTLQLNDKTDIALVRPASGGVAGLISFGECAPLQFGASLTGDGIFLLTIAPAAKNEGRAPVNGLSTTSAPCNTDSVVSAIQFRLIQLPDAIVSEVSNQSLLRNHLAYRCFGVDKTVSFAESPFATSLSSYGLLDTLRTNPLTDCDVPLAILHWTVSAGIKFIDLWSVRRRLTSAGVQGRWAPAAGDRRLSEAEASFLQFQEHLDSIVRDEAGTLNNLEADQRFKFLPAAGYLPVSISGIDWQTFLGPLAPARPTAVVEEIMREILHRSFSMEPIKVGKFSDARKAGVAPPVPVEVYTTPAEDQFVLFARSVRSRIRVFVNPSLSSAEDLTIDASAFWTSELRNAEESSDGDWHELNVTEAGEYQIDVTLPGYIKPNLAPVAAIAGQTSDVQITLAPEPRGSISVNVKDDKNQALINDKVQAVSATDTDGVVTSAKRAASGDWQLEELLPDKYVLSVIASGFGAKTVADVSVTANQTTQVTVTLTASAPPKTQPDACVTTVAQVNRNKFRMKLCMKLKEISFKATKLDDLVLATVDKNGLKWAADWQDWLAGEFRGNNIELVDPKIFVNPTALLGGGRVKEGAIIILGGGRPERPGGSGRPGSDKRLDKKRVVVEGLAVFGRVAVPLTVDALDDEK